MAIDKRIDEIQNEDDGEFFVYLKKGWKLGSDFSQDGRQCQHCFGAVDKKDIKTTMKDVEPCTCDSCLIY